MLKKINAAQDLLLNLISPAENVRIVLLKSSHPREAGECPTEFISMQNSKVGESDRKLPVGVSLVLKDQAMARTVHRLEALGFNPPLILILEEVKVLLVVLVVPRDLPQVNITKVWRDDLLVPPPPVLIPHEFYELVVDYCPMGQEERASCSVLAEKEEVLLGAKSSMISLNGFLLEP